MIAPNLYVGIWMKRIRFAKDIVDIVCLSRPYPFNFFKGWRRSDVFIVNFWTYFTPCSSIFIVNFEHVITGWKVYIIEGKLAWDLDNYDFYKCPLLNILYLLHLYLTNVTFINYPFYFYNFRCSRPEVFYKIGVLRNFAKFIGKHLRQSLFFNKVAGLGLQLY